MRYVDFYFCAQVGFQSISFIDDDYMKTMSGVCMLDE